MNVALPEIDQPVRLRFERPMTDEELMRFCAANEMVRVERDANGELILMSPSGSGTGRTNSELNLSVGDVGEGDELWGDVRFECGIYAAGWFDAQPGRGLGCVAAMECADQGRARRVCADLPGVCD